MNYRNSKQAQTMLEYVVVLGMSLGIIITIGFFIYLFKEHGGRVLDIISGPYP